MKLLAGENLSRWLVPFLQHEYPGSNQVVLLGMESASDKEVWQKARDDGYVIVTRDADFQELSLFCEPLFLEKVPFFCILTTFLRSSFGSTANQGFPTSMDNAINY